MKDFDHVILQKRLYSRAVFVLILLYLKLENIFTLMFQFSLYKTEQEQPIFFFFVFPFCIVNLYRANFWPWFGDLNLVLFDAQLQSSSL